MLSGRGGEAERRRGGEEVLNPPAALPELIQRVYHILVRYAQLDTLQLDVVKTAINCPLFDATFCNFVNFSTKIGTVSAVGLEINGIIKSKVGPAWHETASSQCPRSL